MCIFVGQNHIEMAIPVTLVKVGNSNAFIIPSKILKQMNIKDSTRFELSLEEDMTLQIRKVQSSENLVFPKVQLPAISDTEMERFLGDLTPVSREDIENDERLAYILSR